MLLTQGECARRKKGKGRENRRKARRRWGQVQTLQTLQFPFLGFQRRVPRCFISQTWLTEDGSMGRRVALGHQSSRLYSSPQPGLRTGLDASGSLPNYGRYV